MVALVRLMLLAMAASMVYAQADREAAAAEHARAAQEAQRRGDFATAIHEYEPITQLYPQNALVWSNLGVALYFNHDLERCLAVMRKAIALQGDLAAPHLFSGLAWYHLSNPDAAVPELAAAVRLSPSDVLAHTWLGYAYFQQFNNGAALRELQAANRLDGNNIDVWFALGQTYLQISRDATATLLKTAPDGGRAWQLAGEQARLQGSREKAITDYKNAFERRPDIVELRAALAELLGAPQSTSAEPGESHPREDELFGRAHEAGQQARAAFEHVVQLAPDSYRAHEVLADSLTAADRGEEANAEYHAVLSAKPDLPGIHEAIGKNLLRAGKLDDALTEFRAEVALQPSAASANTYLGQVLLLLGNNEAASKVLTGVKTMDRPPVDLYRLLGKVDLRQQKYRGAIASLTRYLTERENDATGYYLLSKAYAGLGDHAESNRALASYTKKSRDAKARLQAQTQLADFTSPSQEAETASDLAEIAKACADCPK